MKLDDKYMPVYFAGFQKYILSRQEDIAKKYGLKKSHIMFMMVLTETPDGLTLTELTSFLGVNRSHTTRVVMELMNCGYVYRDSKDNQITKYNVVLTSEGREIGIILKKNAKTINQDVLSVLSESEKDDFMKLKTLAAKIIIRNSEKGLF